MPLLFWACGSPECIQCVDVELYPQGEICRETYETILQPADPDWNEYARKAIHAGCSEKP